MNKNLGKKYLVQLNPLSCTVPYCVVSYVLIVSISFYQISYYTVGMYGIYCSLRVLSKLNNENGLGTASYYVYCASYWCLFLSACHRMCLLKLVC
jgi:hypothetical protein